MPVWRPAPIAGGLIGDGGRDLPAAALVIAVAVSRSWAWAALGLGGGLLTQSKRGSCGAAIPSRLP